MSNEFDEEVRRVNEGPVSEGVKIRAKMKRGTGTRDQDELQIEARAETAEDARERFEAAMESVEEYADRLRAIQPSEVDDNE